jgi:hypothetical protein
MPSLDSTTYVANNGVNEQKTIREVIALGGGKTFDILSTKPYWNDLMAAYVDEQTEPLAVLEMKITKAYGALKRAEWWFNEGMNDTHPDDDQWNEAHDAWAAAATHHDQLVAEHERLSKRMDQEWVELNEVNGSYTDYPHKPEGTVLVVMPDTKSTVLLPMFPWPQSEEVRQITTFLTTPENITPEAASPVTYPCQTKLTVAYILADTPGLQKVKAVVTKDGVLQLAPKEMFDSVESWVSSLPYVVAGSMTITLPKPTAGLKQRVTAFAESIDSEPDLTLEQKIRAIYDEFGLKSFVTLGSETHEVDWTTCTSVTPVTMHGRVVGRFARYPEMELFILGKKTEVICPTSNELLCVGGKMVENFEHFKEFTSRNRLLFTLQWKTQKTRRTAFFTLELPA